jgi:transposase
MTMLADAVDVVIGVDTHKHTHTAAVVRAATGASVAEHTAGADPDGYQELLELAESHGSLRVWAIEGTAGYGAGLTRYLVERGERVVELDRPNRAHRRGGAKSDPLDALRAAREALAREHLAEPRTTGERAALSVLLAARRSAVDASKVAQQQLHALVVAAPEPLRAKFRSKTTAQMLSIGARLRVDDRWDLETRTTASVLKALSRRARELATEAKDHQDTIGEIVRSWRPDLLALDGVGPIVAATVLCAWSHPGRCRSDGAFAKLAGAAPIPASSGLTVRYRLNRHGDRQLNRALHTIVIVRLSHDPATKAYAQRRIKEGKTPREVKRCLKRYVARQLFRQLEGSKVVLDSL